MNITIYRYVNRINDKSYVGITVQPSIRAAQHRRRIGTERASAVHKAFEKYGYENFLYEELEMVDSWEEATKKEREYIKKFNSFRRGYNLTQGGDGALGLNGEKCPASKLTEDIVIAIIMDPRGPTIVAKEYNITYANVIHIRNGKRWKHVDRSNAPKYASNKHGTKLTEEIVMKILFDSCSHIEASKKYGLPASNIRVIREGKKSWRHIDRSECPIYKKSSRWDSKHAIHD